MSTTSAQPSESAPNERRSPPQSSHSIFTVPTPIKQLFDKFPLRTYPANELPLRAPRNRNENVLYIFTTEEGARNGAPSFNPSCLKWQTYLKFSGIRFRVASSNNHASPSGALPFLLPSSSSSSKEKEKDGATKPVQPIPSAKLQRWCMNNSADKVEESGDMRYEAYLSLLDHRIRRAWLYSLYLSANSTSLAESLYILPTSTNPFVRLSTFRHLQTAAKAELVKFSPVINAEILYEDAEEAFAALEKLLGSEDWFFGSERPGLFDACVFSYTQLLLDEGLGRGWADTRLRDSVVGKKALCAHRERILKRYYE